MRWTILPHKSCVLNSRLSADGVGAALSHQLPEKYKRGFLGLVDNGYIECHVTGNQFIIKEIKPRYKTTARGTFYQVGSVVRINIIYTACDYFSSGFVILWSAFFFLKIWIPVIIRIFYSGFTMSSLIGIMLFTAVMLFPLIAHFWVAYSFIKRLHCKVSLAVKGFVE